MERKDVFGSHMDMDTAKVKYLFDRIASRYPLNVSSLPTIAREMTRKGFPTYLVVSPETWQLQWRVVIKNHLFDLLVATKGDYVTQTLRRRSLPISASDPDTSTSHTPHTHPPDPAHRSPDSSPHTAHSAVSKRRGRTGSKSPARPK